MTRTLPTYSVQVAWSGNLTGLFTVGTSKVGGTDVVGGYFGGNVFDDITAEAKAITIARGRQNDLSAMQQGTCVITLIDKIGKYNPENPTSALAGKLVPMRPLRVRATHLGTTYGLFYGFISRIECNPDPLVSESTIEAFDLYQWLTIAMPVIVSLGATTVGAAIGRVLDSIGWTDPSLRSLSTGMAIPDFSTDGTLTALNVIQNLLAVDLGVFFIAGSGVATYRDRTARYASSAAVDTFDATMLQGLKPSTDQARIRNRQTVTRTGGVAQVVTNAASANAYGFRDGSPITSAYLSSDTVAANLAAFLVQLQKDPRPPSRGAQLLNTDDTIIPKQLGRELADRVTLTESRGGTNTVGLIEGISHSITQAGTLFQSSYMLTKRVFDVFTVGRSTVGSTDIVGY